MAFLESLPLGKIPGVGKVTLKKMNALGMQTAGDLRRFERGELLNHFGRYGYRLYDLARGIDERPVKAERDACKSQPKSPCPKICLWNRLQAICRTLPKTFGGKSNAKTSKPKALPSNSKPTISALLRVR